MCLFLTHNFCQFDKLTLEVSNERKLRESNKLINIIFYSVSCLSVSQPVFLSLSALRSPQPPTSVLSLYSSYLLSPWPPANRPIYSLSLSLSIDVSTLSFSLPKLMSLCLYLSVDVSVWVADRGVRLIEGWALMDPLNNCQDNNCEMVALPLND